MKSHEKPMKSQEKPCQTRSDPEGGEASRGALRTPCHRPSTIDPFIEHKQRKYSNASAQQKRRRPPRPRGHDHFDRKPAGGRRDHVEIAVLMKKTAGGRQNQPVNDPTNEQYSKNDPNMIQKLFKNDPTII